MFRLFLTPSCQRSYARNYLNFLLSALLLVSLTGCKDYRREEVEIGGRQYQLQNYDLRSTDSVRINYPVAISGTRAAKDFKLTVVSRESTIRVGVNPVTNANGEASFDVTYFTSATPTGLYPVKLVISNSEGDFMEVIATLKVTSIYDLLAQKPLLISVEDTVTAAPFPLGGGTAIVRYSITINRAAGAPAGEYLFSQLGVTNVWGNTNDIEGVRVLIDSVTGALTAPLQSPGGTFDYSGKGKLFFDSEAKNYIRGSFFYGYRINSTRYEGHLSF
jgi:hypothetical protein